MVRLIFILAVLTVIDPLYSQDLLIDTLKNARAGYNSFTLLPAVGTISTGGTYGVGVNLFFSEDRKPLPAELVRIDFAKKTVSYKTIPEVLSANGALWVASTAPTGAVYLSVNVPKRKVIQLDFKDSLAYTDLGNAFLDTATLAYSMSVGRDGKMYFGGSSGQTFWSSLDLKTNRFEKHEPIDNQNDYVLSIAGDSDYVYAQTGQRKSVELWSVRKADDKKRRLFKVPNTTRIEVSTHTDGIYASLNTDTLSGIYKLVNGEAILVKARPQSKEKSYEQMGAAADPNFKPVFDPLDSKVIFHTNMKLESIEIRTRSNPAILKNLFAFPGDKRYLYYTGDYYGNYYRYDLTAMKSVLLGSTGLNMYSTLAQNDSIIFLGGYPSGFLMRWNRNQPWTTNRVIDGKLVEARGNIANPRILGFWKSQGKPMAGFHHTYQMIFDKRKNIVGAGNVIRIGNAASIGVYNPARDSLYGINYEPYNGMIYRNLATWKSHVVYSMKGSGGKTPKLYFYNSSKNIMSDSLDLGFDDYGTIYVKGNFLYGIANNRVYQLDLKKKKIIRQVNYPENSIGSVYFLSNGSAIVQSGKKLNIPFLKILQLKYSTYLETNGEVYAVDGLNLIRLKGALGRRSQQAGKP